jgi:hypothetical protein
MEDKKCVCSYRTVVRKAVYIICKRVSANYQLIWHDNLILDSKKEDNINF